MLQEAVLVKKDIVKIILTAVLMLLLVNCFDRPEKSKKSSSYKNEESEVLTDNNYYREQEVTEPMLFDYANLNYQSSTYDEETNTLVMKYVETNEKEEGDDYSIRAYEGKRKFKADIYKGETEYIQDDDLYYTEYQIRMVISDNTQFMLEISRNNASYTVRCTVETLAN